MWDDSFDYALYLDDQMPDHRELMNRLRKTLYYGGLRMPKSKMLSRPLTEYTADIFTATHKGYSLNRLNHDEVGQLKATPCSLILALIYLDLLKELDPTYVRRVPPSELFLVAMMVSTKFYSGYDEDFYISEWAEYGNISVEQMKRLEIEFLDAMDWKIFVSNDTFFKKLEDIETILARKQSASRPGGWLTYTELCTLMPSIEIIRQAISYSTMLAISYTAGVIAIASAFYLASHVPGTYLYKSRTPNTNTSLAGETDIGLEANVECLSAGPDIDCTSAANHSETTLTLLEEMEQMLKNIDWLSLGLDEIDKAAAGTKGDGGGIGRRGQNENNDRVVDESELGIIHKRHNHTTGVNVLQLQLFPETNHNWQPPYYENMNFLSFLWYKLIV